VARDVFKIPRVLARLYDPARAPVYSEFGIASVGSVHTTVNRVMQLLHHLTLEPQQTFGNGETLLVRSRLPDYLAGRGVLELNVPGEIQVVELSRAGHSRIPEHSTPLEGGDVVTFIVAAGSLGRLRSFLNGRLS
jgi:trk system potassium uptake protein TrkA